MLRWLWTLLYLLIIGMSLLERYEQDWEGSQVMGKKESRLREIGHTKSGREKIETSAGVIKDWPERLR